MRSKGQQVFIDSPAQQDVFTNVSFVHNIDAGIVGQTSADVKDTPSVNVALAVEPSRTETRIRTRGQAAAAAAEARAAAGSARCR